ncbi:MAG: hypothetical protein RL033_4023 [Pseudomonadota bacterium]|jgi:hypothetical protein
MPLVSWSMLLAAFALLGASACSGESDAASPTDALQADALQTDENGQPLPTGAVDCANDARLGNYVDVDTMGELGVLSFRLEQVMPAPPARGTNTFQLQIHDTAGTPMVGELRVELRMPDHGHGTSVRPRISAGPDGQYTIEQLYLFMPGVWRIGLDARDAGATIDRKALFFCIEG